MLKIYEKGGYTLRGHIPGIKPHKGGRIKRTIKCLLHQGEFVLPLGVKPTRQQIMQVRKRHGKWQKRKKVTK